MPERAEQTPDAACRFVRVAETDRPAVTIFHNGRPLAALAGDTLLTALLCHGAAIRRSEFGDGMRAGFCNMGACQDCWVALEDGTRVRACTTEVREGMRVAAPDAPS